MVNSHWCCVLSLYIQISGSVLLSIVIICTYVVVSYSNTLMEQYIHLRTVTRTPFHPKGREHI